MGNFYTNFSVLGPDEHQVVDFLKSEGRSAYAAPKSRGVVVVYDEACDTQDTEEIEMLGCKISSHFECSVLSVLNHDDDRLLLRLFSKGALKSKYDWFIHALPASAMICWHFRQPLMAPFLCLVLSLPWTIFQVFRHMMMVRLMGWPHWTIGTGYDYILRGEIPMGLNEEDLIRT